MRGSLGRRVAALALLAFALACFGGEVRAQGPEAPAAAAPQADIKAVRARLDGFRNDLDQRERSLERDLSNADLRRMREGVDPVAAAIQAIADDLAPRLDATRARLEQLGLKPRAGQPEESAEAVRERTAREAAFAEIDEALKLARALLVQADQIRTSVTDRRRTVFTRALFERSAGLLSPALWVEVVGALPGDLRAVTTVSGDALGHARRAATWPSLLLLGLALGGAIALHIGRQHLAGWLATRDPAIVEPSHRRRLLAALAALLTGAVPAVAGSWLVWIAADAAGLLPARLEPVLASALRGLAFVAFAHGLAISILAPGQEAWRLVKVSDVAASRLTAFVVALGTLIALGKVVETFAQAIAAALPISVAARGLFAFVGALLLADLLRRFAAPEAEEETHAAPPQGTFAFGGLLRFLGWIVAIAVGASALAGYVALASFLIDQVIWVAVLVALLLLGLTLTDEFVGRTFAGPTRVATTLQANTGLRRKSLRQIGVLANGVARVALILAALMLALAPWGVESSDILPSLRAAFFGFRVGDVTISLQAIAIAVLLFALGFAVTRVVQRWLDTTFLPATDLDAGLRNSIRTAFGYVGVILAGILAFSYLGFSLDRVAIIAGALSVGIGFGLQSIVNNFVSGLILLWERPIRVGDQVVVGDGEGTVRTISVRATEIETFDRSTIIVPNSNLISGIVRNRVRKSRTARVLLTVPAPRYSDPDQVAAILRDCGLAHREVMSEPDPRVFFKRITDGALEFDLVCFVDDIDAAARVQSDLYFAAYRALREAGIIQPPPPATINVGGLEGVGRSLDGIAEAVEARREPG